MSSERNKLANYLSWFIRTYEEIRRENQETAETPCSIVNYSKNKEGKFEVDIHFKGKRVIFKKTPEDILADDNITEAFSKKDIRLLTYLACENQKEPKHQMVAQTIKAGIDRVFFRLRHDKTGEEVEKSTEEIFKDSDLIKSLDSEDAYTIGYVTANEQIKKESIAKESFLAQAESRHRLVGQIIKAGINKIFFRLRYEKTGEEVEKSTEEIFKDASLIKSLDSEDAYTIGYVTANEQIKREQIRK